MSDLQLWIPRHSKTKIGRPYNTYIKQLVADSGCQLEERGMAMEYRDYWRGRVNMVRAREPIREGKVRCIYIYICVHVPF